MAKVEIFDYTGFACNYETDMKFYINPKIEQMLKDGWVINNQTFFSEAKPSHRYYYKIVFIK